MVPALHSYTHSTYVCQILGIWVTCGVKTMSLHHGWGWQPTQTAVSIHIRHMENVSAHWYAVHRHMVAALTHLYSHYFTQIFGFWVTCGVKMMSLHFGWGWQSPQTAFCYTYTHITYLSQILGSGHIDMLFIGIWKQPYTVILTWLQTAVSIHIRYLQSVWAH